MTYPGGKNGAGERERIKRKTQRWTRRLETMPDLERYALTAAIDALEDAGSRSVIPDGVRSPQALSGVCGDVS